ncbi:MAG: mechanosensitive ion channel domain-containing protein [Balneolaceae bacterium]
MLDSFSSETLTFSGSFPNLLAGTVVLIITMIVLRALTSRFIRRHVASPELRRKWLVQSRNGLLLIFLLGIVSIWGAELRTLALSIVAIAVAFVVATKELILCITGSILKTAAGSFNIGDRIQVKDFRGDVVDQNLLATTIMEVGPGKLTHQRTGRLTVLPNALFVSEPVINESYTHDYVLHVFTVPFKRDEDWQAAEKELLSAANHHCKPYLKQAREYMNKISDRRGLDIPSVDPRVTIQTPAAGEIHLIVRIPVRNGERSYLEQAILSDVFGQSNFAATNRDKNSSSREDNTPN